MNNLIISNGKENLISSLELVKQINIFREKENKKELLHKNLMAVIRDEFEDEINELKIQLVEYKDKKGEKRPMFQLTLNQAKQVLVRESKFVRKAVIHYIEELEEKLKTKVDEKDLLLLNIMNAKNDVEKANAINLYQTKYVLPLEQEYTKQKEYIGNVVSNDKYYIPPTKIANKFGWSAIHLNNVLKDLNIIFKQGKSWILKTDYKGIADYRYYQKPSGDWEKGTSLYYSNDGEKKIYEILKAHGYEPKEK